MALMPPTPQRRERILSYGPEGGGKTTAWLSIAKWAEATGSDAQFYVLDTDYAVEHMIESPEWPSDRIHVWNAIEWEEYDAAIDEILPKLRRQDWVVSDFVGTAWEAVQDWYVRKIYHTNIDDFFMEARANAKSGNPLDGWKDWSVINRVYKSWINKVVFRNDAQVFLTAQGEGVRDTDSRQLKATFGRVGIRPRAQKQIGHQAHSILLMQALRPNEPTITTVKDRGRVSLDSHRFSDFTLDYLVPVAGWML